MTRSLPLTFCLLAACSAAPARVVPNAGALRDTLLARFEQSATAWNRGDLEAFVGDYARDSLTGFISGGHVQHRFDRIHGTYAPRFAQGALTPAVALVTARFILFRDGRTTASGPFTLVMERRPDGWKILHDHTSSD
jgi:hypothetical protein